MRLTLLLISLLFAVAWNGGRNAQTNKFPQRIGDSLFTTDSIYHLMSEQDTLTKLLNKHTGEIAE